MYCTRISVQYMVMCNMQKPIYKLSNVHMSGNEHGQLKADVIYANLVRIEDEGIEISATLEHILQAIRDRDLAVYGVSVTKKVMRNAHCTIVTIEDINTITD